MKLAGRLLEVQKRPNVTFGAELNFDIGPLALAASRKSTFQYGPHAGSDIQELIVIFPDLVPNCKSQDAAVMSSS